MKRKMLMEIYESTAEQLDSGSSLLADLEITSGRYLNLNKIASGGMKIVYSCLDSHTDREIVLVTPKEESMNELFVREGRINAYLQHPNISPVYDLGLINDNTPYFTSKFISGKPLNELNLQDDCDKTVDVFIKICEAVSYAHSHSVIHQDLKPDNVIIDDFGEVIIIDWGLAEIDDSQWKSESSILDKDMEKLLLYSIPEEHKKLRGTPGFIAPERYNEKKCGFSNDIFSLGALLYTLLHGSNPPKYITENNLSISPSVPAGLKAICEKAIQTKPQNRYSSVKDMLNDLSLYRRGFATEAERASVWRLLKLLYVRNRQFCLISGSALVIIFSTLLISLLFINQSKNVALQEKANAETANTKNLQLVGELKQEKKRSLNYMELSAKNQLISLKNMLSHREYSRIQETLELTLKLDENYVDARLFKGHFEFTRFNWQQSFGILKDLHPDFYAKASLLEPDNSESILKNIKEISQFLGYDFSYYFAVNCVRRYDEMSTKVKFYSWLISFDHPGKKSFHEMKLNTSEGKVNISFPNNYSIRKTGPIHLLNPQILDISSTNIFSVGSIGKCQNLEELNLSRTHILNLNIPFKSLKKLDISETIIRNIYPRNFPVLEILDISGSKWTQFNRIKQFETLKQLIVDEKQYERLKDKLKVQLIVKK